jgi:putative flippase GtrA
MMRPHRTLAALFSKQFYRFLIVGALNTALSYAVYVVGLAVGFSYAVASLISLTTGILVGFKAQGKYVFARPEYRLFWKFLSCWVLIYFVNLLFIREMINLGFNAYMAGALALPFLIVFSFVVQKFVVFRSPGAAPPSAALRDRGA